MFYKKNQVQYFVSWFNINDMHIGNSVVNLDFELHGVDLVSKIVSCVRENVSEDAVVLNFFRV